MWRSVTGERPGGSSSSGAGASPAPGPELASLGLYPQDSPLLGLLSAVSRPAVSILQRWSALLPGRVVKQDLVEQDGGFLRQLDHILPPQQLHSLPWIHLSELGIHSGTEEGGLGTQTLLSHVLVHPPRAETWLSGLWGGAEDQGLSSAKRASANGLWGGAEDRGPLTASAKRASVDKVPSLAPHLGPALPPHLLHCLGLSAELSALSPDLDSGYSSLEEELLLAAKAQLQRAGTELRPEPETTEVCVEEEVPVLRCDNKAIAFIMGCPCSDDSDDDDDDGDDDDDDDDGFDSEGSSNVSDSDSRSDSDEDQEEEEEEEEFDSETERLWSALCQNNDPYSPRNFTAKLSSAPCATAKLGSSPSAPRPIPRATPEPAQVQCSPGTSLVSSVGSSVGSSSSSSSSSSSWDEASEAEAEMDRDGLKLLGAFCSSDPYSPLNFQAMIRTRPGLDSRPDPKAEPSPDLRPGPRPQQKERVRTTSQSSHNNSNNSNSNSSSNNSNKETGKKQVRFLAEVQVFAVGCEERRGHWEELARDRARFAKRCCEMEEVLRSCLQREHRESVYLRLSGFCERDGGL